MSEELEHRSFAAVNDLWAWLEQNHQTHPGLWVVLQKSGSPTPSITFHDLLEAGIAFGWSESTRRANDKTSYLQKFTPRRSKGTRSARNTAIAERLEAEGRMTIAGRAALVHPSPDRPLSWIKRCVMKMSWLRCVPRLIQSRGP